MGFLLNAKGKKDGIFPKGVTTYNFFFFFLTLRASNVYVEFSFLFLGGTKSDSKWVTQPNLL